jgi:biopolymer transport protein ExbB
METLLHTYVINGGPMMYVLVPCSLLTIAAILQGFLRLRRSRVLPLHLRRLAAEPVRMADRMDFLQRLAEQSAPLARASWFTLKNYDEKATAPERHRIEEALDEALWEVGEEMQEGLTLLSTIYTVAPLLGLMGTIFGMMSSFHEYAFADEQSVQSLSVGIQEALITTLWGLGMAIPAFVTVQWLRWKIRRFERVELRRWTLRLIEAYFGVRGGGEAPKQPAAAGSSIMQAMNER